MFQMLESFQIIDSTVKLEVFTQRLDFLRQLASSLPTKADNNQCIDIALQTYTHKYFDKPVSPTIRLILKQPQIASSSKFRDEALTAFYMRYCYKLKNEIEKLKTSAAKQRRITQAAELADIVRERLCSPDRQKYIDATKENYDNLISLCTP